jgi:hypothetical protein
MKDKDIKIVRVVWNNYSKCYVLENIDNIKAIIFQMATMKRVLICTRVQKQTYLHFKE